MENIEREIKYQLCKEDFVKFNNYLNKEHIFVSKGVHRNYYIDSNDLYLKNKGVSVRIREIFNKRYEYTVKMTMKEVSGNIHIKKEYTIELEKTIAEKILFDGNLNSYEYLIEPIIKYVGGQTDTYKGLSIIGFMETERLFYLFGDEIDPINVDKSVYLGVDDYEIEWETNSNSLYKLTNAINLLNIIPLENHESKNARFLSVYKELNQTTSVIESSELNL
ncbi:CYTH domain-containing protein [Clostridium akagii]|uniref:CYTH domain-containing protein n=1 Tax=Clostridium akagii TaxID=91623 RepID=UPI00047E7DC0|nr:CYTH domain-containing protein [Clostridium akagii]